LHRLDEGYVAAGLERQVGARDRILNAEHPRESVRATMTKSGSVAAPAALSA
jgi:hypothetical protein